jgi:hypothetical protein
MKRWRSHHSPSSYHLGIEQERTTGRDIAVRRGKGKGERGKGKGERGKGKGERRKGKGERGLEERLGG